MLYCSDCANCYDAKYEASVLVKVDSEETLARYSALVERICDSGEYVYLYAIPTEVVAELQLTSKFAEADCITSEDLRPLAHYKAYTYEQHKISGTLINKLLAIVQKRALWL